MVTGILSLGLHPSAIDYSRHPGLDEATLTARIAAGEADLREAGFDIVPCQVSADPDEAETKVRECVAANPVGVVMIGAGLRMVPEHTLLFERLVNLLNQLVPGIVFCFNTSPETTVDALRRWVRPNR
jgi:trans-aconitate methyltransferase